ncbi:MAG: TlyA family RNA methyltransferase [Candidatus Taylorbacteria bacterium]|nr:TlyA family RNA methyltransferase [Candidatus Taylorbacteria bacterium]
MQERFDRAIYTLGITRSRSEAEDLIKRGLVSVRNNRGEFVVVSKPSKLFDISSLTKDCIQVSTTQYVSRGAYKLLKAFDTWKLSVQGKSAIDIGSSTGGFTQVLLEKGISKVYAVDVGSDQLDLKLKDDERVVSLESTNIQTLEGLPADERVDFFVIDLSFISIKNIFPVLERFVKKHAEGVVLIKPQFEVGKEYISKNGIVKNEKAVHNAMTNIRNVLRECGFNLQGEIESPIQGGSGNIEYLWYVVK